MASRRCRRRVAVDLAELQAWLDEFCHLYNHHRPHQGIGRQTPISRWQTTPAAGPADEPIDPPNPTPRPRSTTISTSGVAFIDRIAIHVGIEWAGRDAVILLDRTHATVFVDDHLVRHLRIDPARRYQRSGRRRATRPPT